MWELAAEVSFAQGLPPPRVRRAAIRSALQRLGVSWQRAKLAVAEKVAGQKLQELAQTHLSGVRYEPIVHVSGDPARTILEVERDIGADLIVMATHGFTGLFHLILNSLTEKMVREAACPVLSLRQPPEAPRRPQFAKQG